MKTSREDKGFFLAILDLLWVMALGLNYGMTYGLVIGHSEKLYSIIGA